MRSFPPPGSSAVPLPWNTAALCFRRVRWPFAARVLDGELCAATELEGQGGVGGPLLGVFDCLALDGRSLLAEPWTLRRVVLFAEAGDGDLRSRGLRRTWRGRPGPGRRGPRHHGVV